MRACSRAGTLSTRLPSSASRNKPISSPSQNRPSGSLVTSSTLPPSRPRKQGSKRRLRTHHTPWPWVPAHSMPAGPSLEADEGPGLELGMGPALEHTRNASHRNGSDRCTTRSTKIRRDPGRCPKGYWTATLRPRSIGGPIDPRARGCRIERSGHDSWASEGAAKRQKSSAEPQKPRLRTARLLPLWKVAISETRILIRRLAVSEWGLRFRILLDYSEVYRSMVGSPKIEGKPKSGAFPKRVLTNR